MSETPPKWNLDALLREWPEAQKSAAELDESAQAIADRARIGRAPGAVTADEEKFLAPPLGQSTEDGHNSAARPAAAEAPKMTMPADRERDRRSLQDLAKMAQTGLTPPPASARVSAPSGPISQAPGSYQGRPSEAKADDSGMIDLRAAAQSDPAAPSRAQSTPLASQGLFDEEPASVRPPPSAQALAQPYPSMPPQSMGPQSMGPQSMAPQSTGYGAPALAPAAHASASQPAVQAKKGNGAVIALLVGGIVAVSAAAAGTFFYLKTHAPAPAPVAATDAPPADLAPAPPATATVAAQPSEPAEEAAMDPSSLPAATPDDPKDPGKVALAPKSTSKGSRSAPAPEAPKAEAKLTQKDLPTAPTGPAGDLGTAMGKAVGDDGKPKETEAVPAAGSTHATGNVPQKPSQGAVTGAIGAVLGTARACLGPDDPVSHASITFGSSGAVQSVTVTGAAAGKPAESCIKSALMKAKVGPFAEPSYATRVTVRHP